MKRQAFTLASATLAAVLLLPGVGASPSGAQEPDAPESAPRRVIEEIIVTAQKREQSVDDVPISISVVSEEFIAQESITDFVELSKYVPNLQVISVGYFIEPRIRGFRVSNDNITFEPAVTLVMDGVPYSRLSYFTSMLLDAGRVEVLRGPQGTTFGKNTTAGLINVVSAPATDEYTGYVDVQVGDYDRRGVTAAVGGPLVPNLVNFRLAGMDDQQEGYFFNTTAAISPKAREWLQERDRSALRTKLGFPDLLGSELDLSFELSSVESGLANDLYNVKENTRQFLLGFDPNAVFEKDDFIVSVDDRNVRDTDIATFTGNWSGRLLGWNVDAVGGHSVLDSFATTDNDHTPAPAIVGAFIERSPTTTFEIRGFPDALDGLLGLPSLFGFDLGTSNLIAGVFYQKRGVEASTDVLLDTAVFGALAATDSSPGAPPEGFPVFPIADPTPEEGTEDFSIGIDQSAESIAGFVQVDWLPAERWTLGYGMRLSNEVKKGFWELIYNAPNPLLTSAGIDEYTARRKRSEFQFQPKVAVTWEALDWVDVFASWSQAFKGGGFNAISTGDSDEELLYEDETVTEWALGTRYRLLGGAARLNLSLYRMVLNDFQVLTIDTSSNILGTSLVVNADEARAQGVESDFLWLATDWLTLVGSLAFNDTTFVSFPIGPCPPGRSNTDGDEDPRCDLSGRSFGFAPKWSTTLTANGLWPLGQLPGVGGLVPPGFRDVALNLGGTMEFIDRHYVHTSLDRRRVQDSFFRFKTIAGFSNPEQRWSARVTVENLTNETTSIIQGNVTGASSAFVNLSEPPRMIFGSFRWSF